MRYRKKSYGRKSRYKSRGRSKRKRTYMVRRGGVRM